MWVYWRVKIVDLGDIWWYVVKNRVILGYIWVWLAPIGPCSGQCHFATLAVQRLWPVMLHLCRLRCKQRPPFHSRCIQCRWKRLYRWVVSSHMKSWRKGAFGQIREEFREGSVCLTPVGWKEPSRSHFRAISCISGFHEKHFIWPSSPNTLGFCHWDICCKSQAPGNARISIGKVVHLVRLLFMPTTGGITRPRKPAC